MELTAVLGFALVAVTLIVVPGPDWAYILAAGARDHVVAPAVGGLMLGYAAITVLVAFGVGSLVAASPYALLVLTVCGAAYLIHLGVRVLRGPAPIESARREGTGNRSAGHYLMRGAGVSALNPKGLLIFLAILPQFTRPTASWPVPVQLLTLGAVFTIACGVFYLLLGHTADRVLAARPGAAKLTTKVAGAAMVIVGLALLVEQAATKL